MLKSNWRTAFIVLALAVDSAVVLLTAVGAYILRALLPNVPPVDPNWFSQITLLEWGVFLITSSLGGLYRATYHTNFRRQLQLGWKSYLYSMVIVFASIYALRWSSFPRRFTFIFFVLFPVIFMAGRVMLQRFNAWMQKKGYGLHNALVYGYDESGLNILERFSGFPELGYVLKGVITQEQVAEGSSIAVGHRHVPSIWMAKLSWHVQRELIDRIFIPSAGFVSNGASALIDVCRSARIKLKILSPESDQLLQMLRIYDIAGITLYSPPRRKIDFIRKAIKRSFDILASILLLILLSPVIVITSVAILLETGSPVLFRQKRAATKGGKEFDFYKFRSMHQDADQVKETLYDENETDGALFKIRNDPRTTHIGKFIRKFSIDELPQLLNVLKGEMSLVGPRPLPLADFERLNGGPEFWEAIQGREETKPGITGLWQISGRSNLGFRQMVLLDFYYIENQSLLFDLEIMFATIPVVLFGRGAY